MNKKSLSIFEQLTSDVGEPIQHSIWHPQADIYRDHKGWLVKLELAGVSLEDIQISLLGAMLKMY